VAYANDLEEVSITGFGPFPYQVDGDYLGDAERLHIRYEPDALSLIVP
jgi:diacylglycerol kinase family enzyme